MRLRIASLLSLFTAGCTWFFTDPPPSPRDLSVPPDLRVRDLAMPDQAAPDLATSDLATPDLAAPDLKPPPDLATADAGSCAGGYLNSDAGNACPLGCSSLVEPVADEGAAHVAYGTPVTYAHNPPASGPHWPVTATWGRHDEIVDRPWWVHNLEHGGIIFLYNCPLPADAGPAPDGGSVPNACPDVIAAFQMLHDTHPFDQFNERRILITPDPLLPGRIAAVAWDWSYVSNTLDVNALSCFLEARYGRGPENAP